MFKDAKVFSSFSVDNLEKAKEFYGQILGIEVEEQTGPMAMLTLKLATGGIVLIYPKDEAHMPASFTVLNFPVADIDSAVNELAGKGVEFIHYEESAYNMDERGISRSKGEEPNIAWFKDPAGNILSVLEDQPAA